VIDELCHRQPFWYRARADEDRGETPLPLICLVRQPGSEGFLPALSDKLNEAHARDIPHVHIDAQAFHGGRTDSDDEQHPVGVPPLLPLLDRIRTELNHRGYGGTRLTHFNRYRLVDWLTRQRIRPNVRRDDRVGILHLLRQWISKDRKHPDVEADAGGANFWLWILVRLTPMFWFWVWSRSREVRWFMSQDYMTAHSLNFLGLAERLTLGHRPSVSVDEIKKLLVHAFLEDLRMTYRRRLVPFRARRWRRTAHTVVLLDNVTEANGGWELLHLINDVRNETGDPDPFLVVTASDEPPPYSARANLPLVKPDRITYALDRWRQDLPGRRQKKEQFARYLSVALPTPANAGSHGDHDRSDDLLPEDEYAWYQVTFQPRRPALLARQYVMSPLVVLIGISSVGAGGWAFLPQVRAECFPFGVDGFHVPGISEIAPGDLDGIEVEPLQINDDEWECVGYSDSKAQVFGNNTRLRAVQNLIFEANAAAQLRAQDGTGVVSVIYFAGLTQPQADPAAYSALSEELEGLLILQRQLLRDKFSFRTLRVIVANGGDEMRNAKHVAENMIIPLTQKKDENVVGVIGMDRTTKITEDTISILGRHVPIIATTLTGTGLTEVSRLFFQLAPGNDKQAELLELYANREDKRRKVTIYHPEFGNDTYIKTLIDEIDEISKERKPDRIVWPSGYPYWFEPECGSPEKHIAFYAGRAGDFVGFLRRMVSKCADELPDIVGDDATTRFFSERGNRTLDDFNGVSVSHVALGSGLTLTSKCLRHERGLAVSDHWAVRKFCSSYRRLSQELTEKVGKEVFTPFPAARSGLSYDAANILLEAALPVEGDPRSDAKISVPSILELTSRLADLRYEGVTGTITFKDQQAEDQGLAILQFENIYDVDSHPKCIQAIGNFHGKENEDTHCPPKS